MGGGAGGSVSASASLGGDADADGDSTRNADGYTEGIPGPVTRLVVLANRGLANLVQDLILVRTSAGARPRHEALQSLT